MQALPSTMSVGHSFDRIPQAHIQRSSFNRTHARKMTFDAGYLVPFYRDLMLPGDTFNLRATILARLSSTALTKPVMDNLHLTTFFFFCPIRLVWDNFKYFMGEHEHAGAQNTTYVIPTVPTPAAGVATGSLYNHLGIPFFAASKDINTLWGRMYNLTWNQWFRDQSIQDEVPVDYDDGPDTYTDYVLLKRGKRHDYFTSCLPYLQKGTALQMPLGTSAIVKTSAAENFTGVQTEVKTLGVDGNVLTGNKLVSTAGDGKAMYASTSAGTPAGSAMYFSNLYADLSTATASTINALRQSIALQQMLEIDARSGTRYTEVIRAHFGVVSPDARLQRVEFLGSGEDHIVVNPVAGTNNVGSGATAQGQLTAFAQSAGSGHGFTYSATEHGLLLGLVCVWADLTYQQGVHKDFTMSTKYDFYWPSLANIGEEAVLRGEIYADGTANDEIVFGYQERYASYRYKPSEITGSFTSNPSAGVTSLEAWHLSQDFSAAPTLTTTFMQEAPPLARIKAVTTEPDILMDAWIELKCARPMPLFGVPGLSRL